MKSTLSAIEKRLAALEAARHAEYPPLPGFCPMQQEGETDEEFRWRVVEIRAANPGRKVIPFFVVDGR
jgi:hypothetical protein